MSDPESTYHLTRLAYSALLFAVIVMASNRLFGNCPGQWRKWLLWAFLLTPAVWSFFKGYQVVMPDDIGQLPPCVREMAQERLDGGEHLFQRSLQYFDAQCRK